MLEPVWKIKCTDKPSSKRFRFSVYVKERKKERKKVLVKLFLKEDRCGFTTLIKQAYSLAMIDISLE